MQRPVSTAAFFDVPDTADFVGGFEALVVEAKLLKCFAGSQAAGAGADDCDFFAVQLGSYSNEKL